jgi:nitrogen fixation protein FixH
MKQIRSQPKEFTGRHMLIIMVLFFGVIITVNLIMATYSQTSWTGLVVKNSYVASQEFNEKVIEGRAQRALGWQAKLTFLPGLVTYSLQDSASIPVTTTSVAVTFRRPSYEAEDVKTDMQRQADGTYILATKLRDGIWIVETSAIAAGKLEYRYTERIVLKGGLVQ